MTAAAGEPPGAEYVAWAWRQPAAEGPVADFTEGKDSDQPGQSDLGVPVPLLVEPNALERDTDGGYGHPAADGAQLTTATKGTICVPTTFMPVPRRNFPWRDVHEQGPVAVHTLALASALAYSGRESDIMADVDVWEDPSELRIRLDVAVEENAALREENRRLRDLLGPAAQAVPCWDEPSPPQQVPSAVQDPAVVPVSLSGLPWADARSTVEAKLALFKALFAGRSDVYARRWAAKSGKTGWSPAETKWPWERRAGEEHELLPLTNRVLIEHLSRPEPGSQALDVGLYPLLTDDTCRLLACDFDDKDWRGDAAVYYQACQAAGVPAYAEISRSGEGAHVWAYFTEPVPAGLARQLGAALLRDAMTARERMSLASFDRSSPPRTCCRPSPPATAVSAT